jgi:hypothetical protein
MYRKCVAGAGVGALAAALAIIAVSKAVAGPDRGTLLASPFVHYGVCLIEAAMAWALLSRRWRRLGLLACSGLAWVSIAVAMWIGTPCGCGGALFSGRKATIVVGCILSVVAASLLAGQTWSASRDPRDRDTATGGVGRLDAR